MALPQGFLDELRDRVSVSSVVGRRHQLVRKGREFVALCPFHSDSKPSLNIVDDKGFYHCFACGAHGDVIKFVMESEGLGFMEAVEQLAAQAGLDVPKETPEDREKADRRRTLQDVVDLACRWYERQLHTSAGDAGLRYLRDRGLTDETIARFRLGWAPEDRKALQRAMKAEGVEVDVLVEAGLVKRYDDGPRAGETGDYMRGRVLFPITDRRGRIIAFGGRVLGDGQPKYLNSPDTPLFHKGRVLYGLAQAREAAHKSGTLVVAEGYMDVIALAQVQIPAVAPLGTALTEDQIAELWKIVPEPTVCFDGDNAGQRAAARACERALPMLQPGHSLRFVALPEGEDPDSLTRRDGPGGFRKLLEAAEPLVDRLWAIEASAGSIDTPERRADFWRRLRDRVRAIAERTVQQSYADEIEVRIATMRRPPEFRRGGGAPRGSYKGGKWTPPPVEPSGSKAARARLDTVLGRRQQQLILATVIHHPGLLDELGETLAHLELDDQFLDKLRREILEITEADPDLDAAGLASHLRALGYSDTVNGLLGAETLSHAAFARPNATHSEARAGLIELVSRVGRGRLERQLADARRIAEASMSEADMNRVTGLLQALQQITAGASLEDAG
ncbi:MAG: DNA primase [Thalassobaculum sp.]|uniref:DNA primase n=1 Tax=Thalassobaculum sp. TaxID=2022740 RepID=UPI0032ED3596